MVRARRVLRKFDFLGALRGGELFNSKAEVLEVTLSP